MPHAWRVLLALAFFVTLPKRHFREPTFIEIYPVLKADSALPDPEQRYRLPPPVVLYYQRELEELESMVRDDADWVRPAWGMFTLTAAFAVHCIVDNGSSMVYISDRFLKNPIFIVAVSVYGYLLGFGPRFSVRVLLIAAAVFAAVLASLY